MSKKKAIEEFRTFILPEVVELFGSNDQLAKREAWGNFTDGLVRDGEITDAQYESWSNPF